MTSTHSFEDMTPKGRMVWCGILAFVGSVGFCGTFGLFGPIERSTDNAILFAFVFGFMGLVWLPLMMTAMFLMAGYRTRVRANTDRIWLTDGTMTRREIQWKDVTAIVSIHDPSERILSLKLIDSRSQQVAIAYVGSLDGLFNTIDHAAPASIRRVSETQPWTNPAATLSMWKLLLIVAAVTVIGGLLLTVAANFIFPA